MRCGRGSKCLAENCGLCINCLDMAKFGGPNILKKACVERNCSFKSFSPCKLESPRQSTPRKSENISQKCKDTPNCCMNTPSKLDILNTSQNTLSMNKSAETGNTPKKFESNTSIGNNTFAENIPKKSRKLETLNQSLKMRSVVNGDTNCQDKNIEAIEDEFDMQVEEAEEPLLMRATRAAHRDKISKIQK